MAAHAAGVVQKAHDGAVWGGESDFQTPHQCCCQKLPAGVPLQVMSVAWLVLPLLSAIPGSHGNWKRLLRPSCNTLEVRTASSRRQKNSLPSYKLNCCETFHEVERDISVNITSTDSARRRTRTKTLPHKYDKLKTAALRQNYRINRDRTQIEVMFSSVAAPLDAAGSAFTHLWPTETRNCLTAHYVGRKKNISVGTLRSLTRNSFVLGKVRLKPSQTVVPMGLHSFS